MAAGCSPSRAASWRNQNLTFTYLLQRFLGALKTPEVYVKRPFSCSQGLRGLERSQHLLLPLRVEARKAWGCWRQDHWATAKAWEALTTESRCRGPRGTRRRALSCSSRGGISPPLQGFGGSHRGTQGSVNGQGQGGGDTTTQHETLREQGDGAK